MSADENWGIQTPRVLFRSDPEPTLTLIRLFWDPKPSFR
jgi:hypothetical protein